MKYIDLSYDIKSEMPVYPGDMELNSNKEKEGFWKKLFK